jgi:hypothetical protein
LEEGGRSSEPPRNGELSALRVMDGCARTLILDLAAWWQSGGELR